MFGFRGQQVRMPQPTIFMHILLEDLYTLDFFDHSFRYHIEGRLPPRVRSAVSSPDCLRLAHYEAMRGFFLKNARRFHRCWFCAPGLRAIHRRIRPQNSYSDLTHMNLLFVG